MPGSASLKSKSKMHPIHLGAKWVSSVRPASRARLWQFCGRYQLGVDARPAWNRCKTSFKSRQDQLRVEARPASSRGKTSFESRQDQLRVEARPASSRGKTSFESRQDQLRVEARPALCWVWSTCWAMVESAGGQNCSESYNNPSNTTAGVSIKHWRQRGEPKRHNVQSHLTRNSL